MANIVNRSLFRLQLSKSCSPLQHQTRGFSPFSYTPPNNPISVSPNTNTNTTTTTSPSRSVSRASYHTARSPFQHINGLVAPKETQQETLHNTNNNNYNNSISSPALSSIPAYPCVKSACERLYKAHGTGSKERAFFVSDLGVVERQYKRWATNLPRVKPFYAVKCNPDETLLKALVSYGAGFDVASGEEMRAALRHGLPASEIIFANPIKNTKDLKFAAKMGVLKMTFDNVDELYKIKEHAPNSELVLRLLPDDSGSIMRFGVKFGAPAEHVKELLRVAQKLDLKIIGTSFHVGSGCFDAITYHKAIQLCRETFDLAHCMGLPRFTFLDLGGGFPGNPTEHQMTGQVPAFETFAHVIRSALDQYFPQSTHSDVSIIAEPGRYMATAWATLFTYVQGKRLEPIDKNNPDGPRRVLYYINDGVYGSFNCLMFDHAHPQPIPAYRLMADKISLEKKPTMQDRMMQSYQTYMYPSATQLSVSPVFQYASARAVHSSCATPQARDANCLATFFGPTCDSMDCIAKDTPLEELFVGDWVAFEQMGAYTNAAASTFNGMAKPVIHYVKSKQPSPPLPRIG